MSRTHSGKSTDASEAPLPALLTRTDVGAAAIMGAVAYLTAKFTSPTVPWHALLFPAAALAVIAAGRLSDRLWDSTMQPALAPMGRVVCVLMRYAFRVQGGGIAFTAALLFAKRAGLIPLRDVPVIEIFAVGAVLAAAYHVSVEAWAAGVVGMRPADAGEPPAPLGSPKAPGMEKDA